MLSSEWELPASMNWLLISTSYSSLPHFMLCHSSCPSPPKCQVLPPGPRTLARAVPSAWNTVSPQMLPRLLFPCHSALCSNATFAKMLSWPSKVAHPSLPPTLSFSGLYLLSHLFLFIYLVLFIISCVFSFTKIYLTRASTLLALFSLYPHHSQHLASRSVSSHWVNQCKDQYL